jgi:DNA replication initiation complex subunit (GINS family)
MNDYKAVLRAGNDSSTNTTDFVNKFTELQNKEKELIHALVSFIASNPDKTIDVRLEGNKRKDFVLSKLHHIAICETWEFFRVLEIQEKRAKGESVF